MGTLWPLAAEAMGDKISVGPPYFNQTTVPIGLLLMLLLIVGPVLRWRGDALSRHKSLWVPIAVFVGSAIGFCTTQAQAGFWSILALSLAIATAVGSILPLAGRNLVRTPLSVWGMALAHLGFAISVAGMAAESGWKTEKLAALSVGESASVSGWDVKLADVRPVVGDNWVALEGQMQVRRGSDATVMLPQSRQFSSPKQQTTEAALLTRWDGQLYAVIAAPSEGDAQGRWQVRLWWKPFVTLIWYGGLLIAFGGALALVGRIGLFRRKRERGNPWSDA
jgi:cytochrome c-type biogenesis protein CcmF